MQKLPVSICILSWKSTKTLRQTLVSYRKNGLLKISDDITILFQEAEEKDRLLASEFGIQSIALPENIGIGKGIEMLANHALYDLILFLEHDWKLVENQKTAWQQIFAGIKLIQKDQFDVIRYRSRRKPGFPLVSIRNKGKELEYYDDWHQCTAPHLLESLHWLDPAKEFPDKIQKKGDFFITSSRWANWTNNPFLVQKDFLLSTILPFAGDATSFEKNIAPWWVQQHFKIAQGEGLFMHSDPVKYPKKSFLRIIFRRLKNKIRF